MKKTTEKLKIWQKMYGVLTYLTVDMLRSAHHTQFKNLRLFIRNGTKGKGSGHNRPEYTYYPTETHRILAVHDAIDRYKIKHVVDLGCGIPLNLLALSKVLPNVKFSGIENEKIIVDFCKQIHSFCDIDIYHRDILNENVYKNDPLFADCYYMYEPLNCKKKRKKLFNILEKHMKKGSYVIYSPAASDLVDLFNNSKKFRRLMKDSHQVQVYKKK